MDDVPPSESELRGSEAPEAPKAQKFGFKERNRGYNAVTGEGLNDEISPEEYEEPSEVLKLRRAFI